MDVSKIDFNYIELFGGSYMHAQYIFKTEPISASEKTQKKIRKWVEKNYIKGEAYPEKVMEYIGEEASNREFIEFLAACRDKVEQEGTRKKQLFDKFSADLPSDVTDALRTLLEDQIYCESIRKDGTDAVIPLEYGAGFNRSLILKNVSCIPDGDFDCLSFENGSLVKEDSEYKLIGEAENYDDETSTPFAIRFSDAEAEVTVTKADGGLYSGTPWLHIESIASTILNKYLLPGDYLNEREKELLPLIAEISRLSYWAIIPDEFEGEDFPLLKTYLKKYGYDRILTLLENLEKNYSDDKKREKNIEKLNSALNEQAYEPFWRELFDTLTESQTGYPSNAELHCDTLILSKIREEIQRLMETHGYSGKYPDFVKHGSIRGIHLAESYDITYFVCNEKNAVCHIHCNEEYFNGHLMIEFLCGTELLRKNETEGDIYSCLFSAKGRRLFNTISFESDYINENGETESDDLNQRVQIAVKKAELQKLTKDERKLNGEIPLLPLFLPVLIIMGGLFAVFMTIGFILISVLATLLIGMPQSIPSLFTDVHWWLLFLLCWVLFGVTMGIVTVIAKRK